MELTNALQQIKETLYWHPIGMFRGSKIYISNVQKDGISYYDNYTRVEVLWDELTPEDTVFLQAFVDKIVPKEIEVTRDKYMINFAHRETGEVMICNLKEQKFTKVYKDGRKKDVKYPHSFFRGMNGKLLPLLIPQDDHFAELMKLITKKQNRCSNFGTFLVRMFDDIHLETYISAGAKFSTQMTVPYNFFDKDVRKCIEESDRGYQPYHAQFFMDKDIGRATFAFIREHAEFREVFKYLAENMRHIVTLVRDYNYDLKSLLQYMNARGWKTDRYTGYSSSWGWTWDLPQYMSDYARMASAVYNSTFVETEMLDAEDTANSDFPKYPKDVKRAHDYVSNLYAAYQTKFDEEAFAKVINEKWEYEKGDYKMVNPITANCLKKEGSTLQHCVGSYVKKVIDGQSYVIFLRHKDSLDTPLMTVEIYGNRINQAKGSRNRQASYDERQFIKEYAKAKKLGYSG